MTRTKSWSDVRGGLLAVMVIGIMAVATLMYARVGALHGDTFNVYALVGEARGVLVGSEVWLSGQKVGRISRIHFRSPAIADSGSRLEIQMELLSQYRAAIHRDGHAQIRSGGTILGAPVVYMSPGSPAAAEIRDGDTVLTRSQGDVEGAAGSIGSVTRQFPAIMKNIKQVAAELDSSKGTLGALINAPGGLAANEISRTRAEVVRLNAGLQRGIASGFGQSGDLADRASRVLSRVDSVRTLLASPQTSLGRLRKDSSLSSDVADIRNDLSIVRAALRTSPGPLVRTAHDSGTVAALAEAERQMRLLLADLKKHPFRYLSF